MGEQTPRGPANPSGEEDAGAVSLLGVEVCESARSQWPNRGDREDFPPLAKGGFGGVERLRASPAP